MVEELKPLKGVKKHHILNFPLIKHQRGETLIKTLSILSNGLARGDVNLNYFPRTTHLYKVDLQLLQQIISEVQNNPSFTQSAIIHSSSDLGLTHKIKAEHQDGAVLYFDGLYIRVTRHITSDSLELKDLPSKTGYPSYEDGVINEFVACIQEIFPEVNVFGFPQYVYYTISDVNWGKLGLRREGDAQLRLVITDPNYFRITALTSFKRGGEFHVYLGEEDRVHQMIAHDFFMYQEIENFIDFYDIKLRKIIDYQNKLKSDLGGVISPIWKINIKHKMWDNAKKALTFAYETKDLVYKGKLLVRTIENIIEKKLAFFNVPRQLWVESEKKDPQEKVPYPCKHFFEFRLADSKIEKVSEEPINPFYVGAFQTLDKKIKYVSTFVDEIYERERDLITAFQTEFALYAVWISLIALIIAILALFLNIIK